MSETRGIENLLTPFMLQNAEVRGRVVRLGGTLNTILTRYNYPDVVARNLGELVVVAAMLSSSLKSQGILTIQIRGSGLVPLLVVDAAHGGTLRGYADIPSANEARLHALTQPSLTELFGEGAYLAITFDPGEGMQRYQGVVALEGTTIAEALQAYFVNSQQIEAIVKLAIIRGEQWVASGMLLEKMPDTKSGSDSWPYASAVAGTLTREELLAPLLDAPSLLYRLFHEEGVIVYDSHRLDTHCRCSRERIESLLLSMSLTDRADMLVEGLATVHCQFCNTEQRFTATDLGLGSLN